MDGGDCSASDPPIGGCQHDKRLSTAEVRVGSTAAFAVLRSNVRFRQLRTHAPRTVLRSITSSACATSMAIRGTLRGADVLTAKSGTMHCGRGREPGDMPWR